MKSCLPIVALSALLIVSNAAPVLAQNSVDDYYRQWVDYKDGAVSMAFDQTPIPFALRAIHAGTGFQIVIPQPLESKVVNLRVDRQPLEPAVRSVIATIGYKNFALLYDDAGRPNRAIVVAAQPPAPAAKDETKTNAALSADEREKLQKDLERWNELKQEERGRIEDRLKTLPESDEREQLVKLYGRQVLGLKKN
jgi:hypothetical protein